MISSRLPLVVTVLSLLGVAAARGGTIRYELPELLGEHRYDGTPHVGRVAHVETPFGFYSVRRVRLVIEGNVQPGKARGDGVIRQDTEFELEPFVQTRVSFKQVQQLGTTPTVGPFRFDEIYPDPFVPETTPLPRPGGYPPVSFSIGLGLTFSLLTNFPPIIGPTSGVGDATEGIIVDEPIIANVTTAYIILEGPGIVPEPSTALLVMLGTSLAMIVRRRTRRPA